MFLAEGIATCYGCGSHMRVRTTNDRWQYECGARRRHILVPELGHATRSVRLVDAFLSCELGFLIDYESLAVGMWPRTLADERKLVDLRRRVGFDAYRGDMTDADLGRRLLGQLFDSIILWPIGRGRGHGYRWWWRAEETITLAPSPRMMAVVATMRSADRDDVLARYGIPPDAAAS